MPVVRLRLRRPRRGSVVFAEVMLGVTVAAAATLTVPGYAVAGSAFVIGVAGLVRRRGRGLVDVVADRFRDPSDDEVAPTDPDDGALRDVGAPLRLLPALHVADVGTRRSGPVGVVGDGQGFAVAFDVDARAGHRWALSALVGRVLDDPARAAAVQVLVEQRSSRRTTGGPTFAPGRTYQSLPTAGIPLWNRTVVVVRHEPAWAPETVAARGGGAPGARAALVALAQRLVVSTEREGIRLAPLDAPALATLFRELGDPGPDCEEREQAWTTSTACHSAVSVPLPDEDTLSTVLEATAALDIDRCVISVAVSAVDHSLCAVLRIVAPDLDHVEAAVAELVERGLAVPVPRIQTAGVVATLPLGGGARSLAELVNQVR